MYRLIAILARVSEKEKPNFSCEKLGLTGCVDPPGFEPGTL
jgi:hypothetical protein